MTTFSRRFTTILTAALIASIWAPGARLQAEDSPAGDGRTYVVDPAGKGDFKSWPQAEKAAKPGDTVEFRKGSYGDLKVQAKGLKLRASTGAVARTLEVDGSEDIVVDGFEVRASSGIAAAVEVQYSTNVTLARCSATGAVYGIDVNKSHKVTIEHCKVFRNMTGLRISGSANLKISFNLIFKNIFDGDGEYYGIFFKNSSGQILGNTLLDNGTQNKFGPAKNIIVTGDSILKITNNIIGRTVLHEKLAKESGPGAGIWLVPDGETARAPLITYNCFYNNTWNYVLEGRHEDTPTDSTNISADPSFEDEASEDYRLAGNSTAADKGMGGTFLGALDPNKTATSDFK